MAAIRLGVSWLNPRPRDEAEDVWRIIRRGGTQVVVPLGFETGDRDTRLVLDVEHDRVGNRKPPVVDEYLIVIPLQPGLIRPAICD
jgi:hypothetical protein